MKRQWSEVMLMTILGLLSMGAVLGFSQLFNKLGNHPNKEMERQVHRLEDKHAEDSKRIKDLEATVRSLEQNRATSGVESPTLHTVEGPASAPAPQSPLALKSSQVEGSEPVQDALARGWQYVAKHDFDPNNHNRILADLVAGYAVQGLPPEVNRALKAAIEQVNEIGVNEILGEAQRLPTSEAIERLQSFLQTTPKLTAAQRARVTSALAAHGTRGEHSRR